ncbi:MAG: lipoprotein [Candidatus Aenigmarchaeota archaeon]|nr:lipoprotein [Candidatus Aenigmarchaeota archaeon]
MKKYLLLLVLIAVVAGCTTQQDVRVGNNGIVINKFSADPTEVNDNQQVDFLLEMENIGGVRADKVTTKIEGITIKAAPSDAEKKYTWTGTIPAACSANSLNPPNPIDRTPGGLLFCIISLRPSTLPEGSVTPFSVDARVTYNYYSSQVVLLRALNTDENKILRSRGEDVTNPIIVTQDDFSPIKVSIVSGAVPLLIDPTTDDRTFSYRLEVRNVGDGWPISAGELGRVWGTIEVTGPGVSAPSADKAICDTTDMVLRSDGTAPVLCAFKVGVDQWKAGPRSDSILFKIDLDYEYFIKKTATVIVRGTQRANLQTCGAYARDVGWASPLCEKDGNNACVGKSQRTVAVSDCVVCCNT